MKKKILAVGILFLLLVSALVSAYPVVIRLFGNHGDFHTDVYHCHAYPCSSLDQKIATDYGNPNEYTISSSDAGSGMQYFAEYNYMDCYIPQTYIVDTDEQTGEGPWSYDVNFVKGQDCAAPVRSISMNPSNPQVGDTVTITASIEASHDYPASKGPQTVPSELVFPHFASTVDIHFYADDEVQKSEMAQIPFGVTKDFTYTYTITQPGEHNFSVHTWLPNECQCESTIWQDKYLHFEITEPVCGNGEIEEGEECDPPNHVLSTCDQYGHDFLQDYCNSECQLEDDHCEDDYPGCTSSQECDEFAPGTNGCDNTCQPLGFCGDGEVDSGEECELPDTNNNAYCNQTTEQCSGNKLGTRDSLGDCDTNCGCDFDTFNYQCVAGECGAECAVDADCNDADPNTVDTCNLQDCTCEYEQLPYCGDGKLDPGEECEPPNTVLSTCDQYGEDYLQDYCDSNCQLQDDDCEDDYPGCTSSQECDEFAPGTNGCDETCQPLPECGDGNVDPGEECELPNTEDNSYCTQSTEECSGNKLGTRDSFGDCGGSCGCVFDEFNYQCVEGRCGAECAVDADCEDSNPLTEDTCNLDTCACEYENIGYCGDGIVDPDAGEECEPPNTVLSTCDEYGEDYLQDYCDSNCKLQDNHCEDDYPGCTSSPECDEFAPGTNGCDATCQPLPFCGDGSVDAGEECELPNTNDNSYCTQSTETCSGNKLGTRDSFGNCDSVCDCDLDSFNYQCVEGRCGAECAVDADCNDSDPTTADTCNIDTCTCEYEQLPYCGDGKLDPGEECEPPNTVLSTCDQYGHDFLQDYCDANCQLQDDDCEDDYPGCTSSQECDEFAPGTNGCDEMCQPLPECGDGNLDPGEECEPPNSEDNQYCEQSTEECSGNKLGTRDAFGNCNAGCGCVFDSFNYQCVEGRCGAECAVDADCNDSDPTTADTCNLQTCQCEYEQLPYCGDGKLDPGEECEPPNTVLSTCDQYGADYLQDYCDANCQLQDDDCEDDYPGCTSSQECDEFAPGTNGCDETCQPLPECGDGNLDPGEECEPPNSEDNQYCEQSTEECSGNKLGTRDAFGDCGSECGCDFDSFNYQCVEGRCGAECAVDADCEDYDPHTADTCNIDTCQCEYEQLPYCGDGKLDPGEECEPPNTVLASCDQYGEDYLQDYCDSNCQLQDDDCEDDYPGCTSSQECDEFAPGTNGCDNVCQPLPFCGDGTVNAGEDCELPNTDDNSYCTQSTEECSGNKLGTRDSFGDCDSTCGCDFDTFTYQCVEGRCGAECAVDSDCDDYDPHTADTCNIDSCTCEYEQLPYCGDGKLDPGEECEPPNTVLASCDQYGADYLQDYCDANCQLQDDDCEDDYPGCTSSQECDEFAPGTNGCDNVCQPLPFCGDGTVDPKEECELPNTNNNNNCNQTTEQCSGNKLGTRDTFGDCNSECGCVEDPFNYQCVAGECGAECDTDDDCDDGIPTTEDSCDLEDCTCKNIDVGFCGDDYIEGSEECEPPSTLNNPYCPQSTQDCYGHKLGTRDQYGNCDSTCGCDTDPFTYRCVEDECGAECDSYRDCPVNNCTETYEDYCEGHVLYEYDTDKTQDDVTVVGICLSSCSGNCLCSNCTPDCSAPPVHNYCVEGECGAECDSDDDCGPYGTCTDGCVCEYEQFCGDGNVDATEECELPDTQDNQFCEQSTEECASNKLGTRDQYGDCGSECGCVFDEFTYECVADRCGAECAVDADCDDYDPNTADTCNIDTCQCEYEQLPYCGDGKLDPGEECEPPNTVLASCDQYGEDYLQDYCDSNCQLQDDDCEDDYPGCTSSQECDEFAPGTNGCDSTCQPLPFCGDGDIDAGEECELPNTDDNTYCTQSTEECSGNKLGTRDSFGDCGDSCGCVFDDFAYECVADRCGAECAVDADCDDYNPNTADTCNLSTCQCEYEQLPYCGDGDIDAGEDCELPSTSDNTYCTQSTEECSGNKLGTRDSFGDCNAGCGCVFDDFEYGCVADRCGAECAVDSDCNDSDPTTADTCNLDTCQCEYEQLSYCGDGKLDPGEECEPPNTVLSTCDQYGADYLQDYCDANCQLQDDDCEDDYPGCTSSQECDEFAPGTNGCDSTCQPLPFCGDGTVDAGESCELPNTENNPYCTQSTEECSGNKLGTRDVYGDCTSSCGCENDPFEYQCVAGECGAECADFGDCELNSCSETYDDYCEDNRLLEYDNDKMLDSLTIQSSCVNTCGNDCMCSDCEPDCSAPTINEYCVQGVCGAECDSDDDCGPYGTCRDNCTCEYEPHCGDGFVDTGMGETCELPDTQDNSNCEQTTEQCSGNKLGTRDAFGDCNSTCGCSFDDFTYQCVPDQCGAQCVAGETESRECGSDVGECEKGTRWRTCGEDCLWGEWGPCRGETLPEDEVCDNLDNDCDGFTDENLTMECGEGECIGNRTCEEGVWSDCSSYLDDCGVCAACDVDGICSYDDTQDTDCPVTECVDDCTLSPDDNPFTWDFAEDVPNECVDIFTCSENECTYDHRCSMELCDAQCETNANCTANQCSITYNDTCSNKKLVEYDNNKIQDSTTVEDTCENTCLDNCSCTDCSVECPAPEINEYCVPGVCGAECANDTDCSDSLCEVQYNDTCDGRKLVDYNNNQVQDSLTVSNSTPNTCLGDCLCTENPVACAEPEAQTQCVAGVCNAECAVDSDCDDGNMFTTDVCLDNCTCSNEGIHTEGFEPLIWMCEDRIVYDDNIDRWRTSDGGENLTERNNNYAFEGEQIEWTVLVMDKNGVEKIEDVFVTVGPEQANGEYIEANCQRIPPPECETIGDGTLCASCNARIGEEQLLDFNTDTMDYYRCTLTVEAQSSMHGEYWVTANVMDLSGQLGTMDENEYWFFNPDVGISVEGTVRFDTVRPGTESYSETVLIGNAAEEGSGVIVDMFISGKDFYDSSSSGAKCPTSNVLRLNGPGPDGVKCIEPGDASCDDDTGFRYFASNGAYSTMDDKEDDDNTYDSTTTRWKDSEGFVNIQYGDSFDRTMYNEAEILQANPVNGGSLGYAANLLAPGAQIPVTFKLVMPEPCNGNFDQGQIFFWADTV